MNKKTSFFLLFLFFIPNISWGALGETPIQSQGDLPGSISTRLGTFAPENISELVLKSPLTEIHEYSQSPNKPVFCITWNGQVPPEMSRILGQYYSEYQTDQKLESPHSLSSRIDSDDNLEVIHSGHMRSLYGLACLKNNVPSGITPGKLP